MANIKSVSHPVLTQLPVFSILVGIHTTIFFPYYHWDAVQRLYELSFPPVSIQGLQPSESDVLPPVKHKKRGRPKVARIRANYQAEKRIHLCSIWQQPEHNRRICPNQPVSHGRAQRVRDPLVEGMYLNPIT